MSFLKSCLLLLGVGVYFNPFDSSFISDSFICLVDKLIIFGSTHFVVAVVVVVAGIFVRVLVCLRLKNTYLVLCRCRLYRFSDMYSLESSLALHACYCYCCCSCCCCCYCCCMSNWKFSFVSLVVFHCLLFFHSPYIVARCAVFFHICNVYFLVVATLTVVANCSLIALCFLGWNFD